MKVRSFLIENSAGETLDLSASPDLFAFNPEGLGISIDNDLVSSGGSFLVNNREIVPGEITLSLLLGALEQNPYNMYDHLISILAKPPYNIVYSTVAGTWRRSCIVKDLSKTEINALNVMTESIVFQCTTPWYNYITNEYPAPPTQGGDGKIYSKHTNWKYASDGYTQPPMTGYKQNEFWKYDPKVAWPGKNIAGNLYYDELVVNAVGLQTKIFEFDIPSSYSAEWSVFEADVEISELSGSGTLGFINGSTTEIVNKDTKHVRITKNKPGKDEIVLSGITGVITFKNLFITYSKVDKPNIAQGKFSKPTYWLAEDKNILGGQTGEPFSVFSTADGVTDARYIYNVIPSIYPKHYPNIYEAHYTFDHRFTEWTVTADKILISDNTLKPGNIFNYSVYVSNSATSDDSIGLRLVFLNKGVQLSIVTADAYLDKGNSDFIRMNNVTIPANTTVIEVQIFKKNSTEALNMGARFGSKRLYIEDLSSVLLTTTQTRAFLFESDWIVAENPEKVSDGEYYGYIYDYIYDADEKPTNTYLIENNSLYLRSAVNSPCEIVLYGPATKPRWELYVDSQVKFTDGFNLDIPDGYKLIVSSLPNEQRAVMVDTDGRESNVYQQQNLAMTNFIRIPPGPAILMVYGTKGRVDFRYREERDVV